MNYNFSMPAFTDQCGNAMLYLMTYKYPGNVEHYLLNTFLWSPASGLVVLTCLLKWPKSSPGDKGDFLLVVFQNGLE